MTFLNRSQGKFKLFFTEAKSCAFIPFIPLFGEALKSERKKKRKKHLFPLKPLTLKKENK